MNVGYLAKHTARQSIEFAIGFYLAKFYDNYFEPKISMKIATSQYEDSVKQQQQQFLQPQQSAQSKTTLLGENASEQPTLQPAPKNPKHSGLHKVEFHAIVSVVGLMFSIIFIRCIINKLMKCNSHPVGITLGFLVYMQANDVKLSAFIC